MRIIDRKSFLDACETGGKAYHKNYYAMYSSVLGGIVTDPGLMLIPIDDHMVHRGDGVFEAFKCVDGNIYNIDAHMSRLVQSASLVEQKMGFSPEEMKFLVKETVKVGGHRDCTIRMFISRGPGSFGVNPYDCPAPQLYIIVHNLGRPFMELHPEGASAAASKVAIKPAFFAEIKSCNYLSNVLMKKEAVDTGVDYVFGFDENGNLTEGACENVGIVTGDGYLFFPCLAGILSGTTMLRSMDLAEGLKARGLIKDVLHRNITEKILESAPEILVVGTTPDLVAVTRYNGKPVGDGKPGPVWADLGNLLKKDILTNKELQTPVFE